MIRRRGQKFWKGHKVGQISFKRYHFVLLMCIGLIAILAFTMVNNQFASAGNMLVHTPEYPIEPMETLETHFCDTELCHDQEPKPSIDVVKIDETPSSVTYTIDGSTDWPWEEGWAVLDESEENNLKNGEGPGQFTLQKGEAEVTYRVYWVDADTELFGMGGATFEYITIPISTNSPPSTVTISLVSSGCSLHLITLMFFFLANCATASSVKSGAITTSTNIFDISSAVGKSTVLLNATIPPKIDTGSQS